MAQHKYKVGDKVLVGPHISTNDFIGNTFWAAAMDKCVGKEAIITHVCAQHKQDPLHLHYHIDIDKVGYWREEALTLIGSISTVSNKTEYGAKCSKCGDFNEYTEKKPNFTCYGCRH